jgi:hypothetical protein
MIAGGKLVPTPSINCTYLDISLSFRFLRQCNAAFYLGATQALLSLPSSRL